MWKPGKKQYGQKIQWLQFASEGSMSSRIGDRILHSGHHRSEGRTIKRFFEQAGRLF